MIRNSMLTPFLMAQACCLIVGVTPVDAQPQRRGINPAPKELNLPTESVSIPMQRFRGCAVEAQVNGKGPFLFAIDTGAPGLFIDSRFADKMNLSPDPDFGGMPVEVRVAGPGGGEGLPATLHQVESLKLGAAELRQMKTIATELPMGRNIAGVIGMGLFRDCLLTLDYPASKVTLERGDLPPADGRDTLDFTQPRQRGSHPVLALELCGNSTEFTVDTGMSGWIRFPAGVEQTCGYSYGPVDGPKGRTVDQEIDTRMARLDGNLVIGRHTIQNPHGRTIEDGIHLPLIGSRILQEFAISIDQKNSRIRFARKSLSPIAPKAFRTPGFALLEEDAGFIVWGLMSDSPAARSGLKNGDVVVALNGNPPGDVYGPAWPTLLESGTLRVQYRRAGQDNPQTIDVPVSTLIP